MTASAAMVLPDPLSPTRAVISPSRTSRSRPSSTGAIFDASLGPSRPASSTPSCRRESTTPVIGCLRAPAVPGRSARSPAWRRRSSGRAAAPATRHRAPPAPAPPAAGRPTRYAAAARRRPRKDSAERAKIMSPTRKVKFTTSTGAITRSRWVPAIWARPPPSCRDACTKSRSRCASVSLRTRRASDGQEIRPSSRIRLPVVERHDGAEEDQHHQAGQRQHRIEQPHQRLVEQARAEPGRKAVQRADDEGDGGGGQRHVERRASGDQQAGEGVAAEIVGAERVGGAGAGEHAGGVQGVRVAPVQHRADGGSQQDDRRQHQAGGQRRVAGTQLQQARQERGGADPDRLLDGVKHIRSSGRAAC